MSLLFRSSDFGSGTYLADTQTETKLWPMAWERKVWQLGTGDPARSYWPYMQANEVALIGPGDAGKYPDPRYDDEPAVRHFAEAPTGDIVVARRGSREALGIGVLGPYKWSRAFDDVEGWNLQHYRRVRWWEPLNGPKQFKERPFARSRFTACHSAEVDQWVERVRTRQQLRSPRSYKTLPSAKPDLAKSALSMALRRVVRQAEFLREQWMSGQMGRTSTEAELLTHITVPLLEALGWAPEQIAIGWEYTDLALFRDPPFPREPVNCRVVIEGKRMGSGLDWARDQAQRYVRDLGVAGQADFVVTDGLRYRLFEASNGYDSTRALEANLTRLKRPATKVFSRLAAPGRRP